MAVTLQVNVAPSDLPHAGPILRHQLRVWGGQVDEVLYTLDLTPPAGGRFAEGWEERRAPVETLLDELCATHPGARVGAVDASPAARRAVAERFLADDDIPLKDSRGGPLYSYFHGLHEARHDLVLHMDSDMLYGGGSQTWVAEATALLAARDDVLAAGPLPGPPRADGALLGQAGAEPDAVDGRPAHRFPTLTTRVFLLDRRRFAERVWPLALRPPLLWRSRVKARWRGHPPYAMPEQLLSIAMREHRLWRVDFLGRAPGMWSLHPPHRSASFYAGLDELVARIEAGDVPDAQRGDYDVNDSLVDWSDVRAGGLRARLRS